MSHRTHICFTFAGDVTRDSRLRRFAAAAAEMAEVYILQLTDAPDHSADAAETVNHNGDDRVLKPLTASENESYRVIPFPRQGSLRSALPRFWRQASAAIRELGCDLVIASDLYTLPAASRAARKLKCPLMYDARELYSSVAALQDRALMQRFWTGVEKRYGRSAATIFTVNDSIAEILRKRYADVRVVRNVPDWPEGAPSDRLREAVGIRPNLRVLLSQGGLQRGRGAILLVNAMPALTDCHLVFLGEGDLRGDIEAAARFAGVSDRVTVLPAVPSAELPAWTASADLGFCLIENLGQSYYLSLPNKLFEYLAAGVPVVGSDFPEIGALLRDTGAGIAVDPSEPDMLVRAVRTLIDDGDRYSRAKAACREAAAGFRWERERTGLLQAISGSLPPA